MASKERRGLMARFGECPRHVGEASPFEIAEQHGRTPDAVNYHQQMQPHKKTTDLVFLLNLHGIAYPGGTGKR